MKFIKQREYIVLDDIILSPEEIPIGSEWMSLDSGCIVTVLSKRVDDRTQNNWVMFTAGISKVEITTFKFQIEYRMIVNDKCCEVAQ